MEGIPEAVCVDYGGGGAIGDYCLDFSGRAGKICGESIEFGQY